MKNRWLFPTSGRLLPLLSIMILFAGPPAEAQPLVPWGPPEGRIDACDPCTILPDPAYPSGRCQYVFECPTLLERVKLWKVECHPNPASEWLHMKVEGRYEPGNAAVRIMDLNELIHFQQDKIGGRELRIPVENLPEGYYTLQLLVQEDVVASRPIFILR